MKHPKIELVIEKTDTKTLWGRVTYDDDLLSDEAEDIKGLESKLRKLLLDFYQLENVEFSYSYDLSSFFDTYSFLKISKIAELAEMNSSLLRHYAGGSKTASAEQVKKIENAVHSLAAQLSEISLIAA